MPFGLVNLLGVFQEVMSIVFHGLGDFTMVYWNDIKIFSASEEHKQHIQKIDCLS